jgi:hypothetical protein
MRSSQYGAKAYQSPLLGFMANHCLIAGYAVCGRPRSDAAESGLPSSLQPFHCSPVVRFPPVKELVPTEWVTTCRPSRKGGTGAFMTSVTTDHEEMAEEADVAVPSGVWWCCWSLLAQHTNPWALCSDLSPIKF